MKDQCIWGELNIFGTGLTGLFRCRNNATFGPRELGDFTIWIGLEGQGNITFLGHEKKITGGSLVLCPPGYQIKFRPLNHKPLQLLYTHFEIINNSQPIRQASAWISREKLTISLPDLPEFALLGRANKNTVKTWISWFLLSANHLEDDICQLEYYIQVLKVIRYLRLNFLYPTELEIKPSSPMERAVLFLHENLDRQLSLADIA